MSDSITAKNGDSHILFRGPIPDILDDAYGWRFLHAMILSSMEKGVSL